MAAYTITEKNIMDALGGLPREKEHCSVLGASALKKAIGDYAQKVTTNKLPEQLALFLTEVIQQR